MKHSLIYFCIGLLIAACGSKTAQTFSEKIETAHEKAAFLNHEAVQFDIQLYFGGSLRLDGTISLRTNSSKGLISEKDGTLTYFDGADIYADTSFVSLESARFSAYTWTYFFMLPYKLNDTGTQWSDYAENNLNGELYEVEKLSFETGTGDAPDDWYIVYADKENHQMQVAAYIVTAGESTVEEAEVDPHAIEYKNYTLIDGIPMSTEWVFHAWREKEGLTKVLGNASLRNIQFVELDEAFFTPPPHFIKG